MLLDICVNMISAVPDYIYVDLWDAWDAVWDDWDDVWEQRDEVT